MWTLRLTMTILTLLCSGLLSVAQAAVSCRKVWRSQPYWTSEIHSVSDAQGLWTQSFPATDRSKPTLLLMPGVNRGLLPGDPAVQLLIKAGYGVSIFHFSAHPLSIAKSPESVQPSFLTEKVTLASLARETESVAAMIKRVYPTENVIPVSLSYSGAVSAQLKGFPLIIETAPMTSDAAANPQLATYRRTLKAGEIFNPFFGPSINRNLIDSAYEKHWMETVASYGKSMKLSETQKERMLEGYKSLSRAAEDASWDSFVLDKSTRRVFVIAQNESKPLLVNQLETLKKAIQNRSDTFAFVIQESGHIVPKDQPASYSVAVALAAGLTNQQPGLAVIKPGDSNIQVIEGKAATLQSIDQMIQNLK